MERRSKSGVLIFTVAAAILCTFFAAPLLSPSSKQESSTSFWQVAQSSQPVLRLHVLADSDMPKDQAFKLEVVELVQHLFIEEMARLESSEGAEPPSFTGADISSLEKQLQDLVVGSGSPTKEIHLILAEETFPLRAYGNNIYPPGEYAALKVIIGEGRGENWWCLLFPPLCLSIAGDSQTTVSSAHKDCRGENKEITENIDGEEEIISDHREKDQRSSWKFLIIEIWERWFRND